MTHDIIDCDAMIADMGSKARKAARIMAGMSDVRKSAALMAAAVMLREECDNILAANALDMAQGEASGLSSAMLDRLKLDKDRVLAMADGVEAVAGLPDPVGTIIDENQRPNGLMMQRVRVPLGVIGIIYESRPNVTADAGVLSLKSGNAVILRGGSEAQHSNRAIHAALVQGLLSEGIPETAIQLVSVTDRAAVGAMLRATGLIDIIIPRGGKSLVARVQDEARVPVLAHLDGINHVYIDGEADPEKAIAVTVNAKMRRTGVCGSMETLLIDRAYPEPFALVSALLDAGCVVRGDKAVQALDTRIDPATDMDWNTEYLDAIASVGFVDGVDGAMAHIAAHGSGHTDAIITENAAVAAHFLSGVDSAIVMHNASTQFADGAEFGLGAEIGISTGRLHARGPVALEGLTTYKWIVRGTGQIRP